MKMSTETPNKPDWTRLLETLLKIATPLNIMYAHRTCRRSFPSLWYRYLIYIYMYILYSATGGSGGGGGIPRIGVFLHSSRRRYNTE